MNITRLLSITGLLFSLPVTAVAEQYDANIQFANKIVVSVPVSGEVSQVKVNKGDQFNSNDVLLTLNKIPFEAAVQKARALVAKTQTLHREADRDHQHLLELYDRGVLSKLELENGELKLKRATADYESARAQLTQAQYNLQHSEVIAPFKGLVLDVRVHPHESVNNTVSVMPLMTIAEMHKYTATALVPLSVVNKLKIASKSKVAIGKNSYTGSVSGIAYEPKEISSKEKLYEVLIDFNSDGRLIRAGQTASVSF